MDLEKKKKRKNTHFSLSTCSHLRHSSITPTEYVAFVRSLRNGSLLNHVHVFVYNLTSGLRWKDASVVKRYDKIFLKAICKDHGMQETLYCANVAFFERVMSYSLMKRMTAAI